MTAVIATLVSGFAAATEAGATECGTCEGPAVILNDQLFLEGNAFSGSLDVIVEDAPEAVASAGAIGNTYTGITNGTAIEATNTQVQNGTGSSSARLQANVVQTGTVVASTFGNGLKLDSGDAHITATSDQLNTGNLSADAYATGFALHDTAVNAASVANAVSAETGNGEVYASIRQAQTGNTTATTGVLAHALGGTTIAGAEAAANTLTTTARYSGGAQLHVDQRSDGPTVIASSNVAAYQGQTVAGLASATGNSVSSEHWAGYAQLTGAQANNAYIRAESYVDLEELELDADATAIASGNLASISNTQSDGYVALEQTNFGGGVAAEAVMTVARGGAETGYTVNAQAYGNALTATGCSECNVRMSGQSHQVNGANVIARGTINGGSGSAYGSVVAVGNSATYQVNRPQ